MKQKIYCFGEVLWDVFPDGKKLGGAPFNVAVHLHQLKQQVSLISKVGNDDLGREILSQASNLGLDTSFIQIDSELNTGTVEVTLDKGGSPSYMIVEPVAWDNINLKEQCLQIEMPVLVFGTLASRSLENQTTLLSLVSKSQMNICDLNIRKPYIAGSLIEKLLKQVHILKINDEELQYLCELFDWDPLDFYECCVSKFKTETIIQTKGSLGAEVYHKGKLFKANATQIDVVDTVGSGDAFLAGFIHHYLEKFDMQTCLEQACLLGAFVATHRGATPKLDLFQAFRDENQKSSA